MATPEPEPSLEESSVEASNPADDPLIAAAAAPPPAETDSGVSRGGSRFSWAAKLGKKAAAFGAKAREAVAEEARNIVDDVRLLKDDTKVMMRDSKLPDATEAAAASRAFLGKALGGIQLGAETVKGGNTEAASSTGLPAGAVATASDGTHRVRAFDKAKLIMKEMRAKSKNAAGEEDVNGSEFLPSTRANYVDLNVEVSGSAESIATSRALDANSLTDPSASDTMSSTGVATASVKDGWDKQRVRAYDQAKVVIQDLRASVNVQGNGKAFMLTPSVRANYVDLYLETREDTSGAESLMGKMKGLKGIVQKSSKGLMQQALELRQATAAQASAASAALAAATSKRPDETKATGSPARSPLIEDLFEIGSDLTPSPTIAEALALDAAESDPIRDLLNSQLGSIHTEPAAGAGPEIFAMSPPPVAAVAPSAAVAADPIRDLLDSQIGMPQAARATSPVSVEALSSQTAPADPFRDLGAAAVLGAPSDSASRLGSMPAAGYPSEDARSAVDGRVNAPEEPVKSGAKSIDDFDDLWDTILADDEKS